LVLDASRRLLYLRVAIVAGILAGMILSYRLWLSTRFYPLTPVFPFLKPIPAPFDYILFGAVLAALAASALTARLIPIFATLAVVLAVCDQSRLQPWFFESFFLLLGVAFASPNACRLIVASTYIWGGIQKMNAGFINDVFPAMLEPFLRHLPPSAHGMVHPLATAAPFVELGIGLMLLGRKFRVIGVPAAVAMQVLSLITLRLLGHNNHYALWTWNLAMAAIVVILFWKTKESVKQIVWGEGPFHIAALLLFSLAPAMSLYGGWDHYLSEATYASNTNRGMIFFSGKMLDRLPDGIADYARVETPEIDSIDIAEWSAGELKAPPYPEVRIYKNIARKICSYAENPADVRLSITIKSTIGKSITGKSYSCGAVEK
jgi:hypothetical protein